MQTYFLVGFLVGLALGMAVMFAWYEMGHA